MTPLEFANLIAPSHCRNSCFDGSTSNGWGSNSSIDSMTKVDENGVKWKSEPIEILTFRCKRCAVLEILDGYVLDSHQKNFLSMYSYETVMAAVRFMEQ